MTPGAGSGSQRGRARCPGLRLLATAGLAAVLLAACAAGPAPSPDSGRPTIIVTYAILGALVRDLVGDEADVVVLMPNGVDPHEWQPTARDLEKLTHADLLVENGLGLEAAMTGAFEQAAEAGVRRFVVTDHVTVRTVGAGEGADPADPDQAAGAGDPHVWTDPLTMRKALEALAPVLEELGIDAAARAAEEGAGLEALDAELRGVLAAVPAERRKLVTGHESLGYFADRYGFSVIGAVVPGLSSQGEPSAADLAALSATIRTSGVRTIFVEVGTPAQVAEAIGRETGVDVVELTTHALPADGSYATFMRDLAAGVAAGLE
ncbi:MAG: metal ABC transporter substrate-binding protein [Chloroflexi bacterium]|nr:metal ABC transporter substrate-binding protein [Chloroflexota bacterium]